MESVVLCDYSNCNEFEQSPDAAKQQAKPFVQQFVMQETLTGQQRATLTDQSGRLKSSCLSEATAAPTVARQGAALTGASVPDNLLLYEKSSMPSLPWSPQPWQHLNAPFLAKPQFPTYPHVSSDPFEPNPVQTSTPLSPTIPSQPTVIDDDDSLSLSSFDLDGLSTEEDEAAISPPSKRRRVIKSTAKPNLLHLPVGILFEKIFPFVFGAISPSVFQSGRGGEEDGDSDDDTCYQNSCGEIDVLLAAMQYLEHIDLQHCRQHYDKVDAASETAQLLGCYFLSRTKVDYRRLHVQNAGLPAVNGEYTRDGTIDGVGKFVKKGRWNNGEVPFTLYRFKLCNDTKHWYISVPPAGAPPGTTNDTDFYSVPAENDADTPPLKGWRKEKDGLMSPPIIVMKESESAIKVVLTAMKAHPKNSRIQAFGARCLGSVVNQKSCATTQALTCRAVIQTMQHNANDHAVQRSCAATMYSWFSKKILHLSISEEIVDLLLEAMRNHETSKDIRQSCIGCFSVLMTDGGESGRDALKVCMFESSSIHLVLDALGKEFRSSTQTMALSVLASLISDEDGLEDENAGLIDSDAVDVRVVSRVMFRSGHEMVIRIMNENIEEFEVQRDGLKVLAYAASNHRRQASITNAGGIDAILRAMRDDEEEGSDGNADIQLWGCRAIVRLARGNLHNIQLINAAGGGRQVVMAPLKNPKKYLLADAAVAAIDVLTGANA